MDNVGEIVIKENFNTWCICASTCYIRKCNTKDRFEKRLEEGCDIECDELYNTWNKLKKQITEKAEVSTCSPQSQIASIFSPVVRVDILSIFISGWDPCLPKAY